MNITGKHIRLRPTLSLICFVALAGVGFAQDVTINNLEQLAGLALSPNHSLWLPWTPWQIQAYPTDGGEPWWIDCSQVTCADLLSTSTNSCATLQMHGVTVTSVVLTKNILTGETLLYSGCSTDVVATIEAPSGYEPGAQLGENAWVWRQWQAVTNCLDCWGLTADEIPPPIVTLKTRLADASMYSIYQSNLEAEAAVAAAAWAAATTATPISESGQVGDARATGAGRFMAMEDDDISCTITDEILPFSVTQIEQDGSGNTFLTWTSCSDHIYGVFSSTDLSTWVGIAAMWGDDLATTWEDTNTASGATTQFYKVVRIPPSEGFNGDAIPSGWAVDNGLNPLDPNLDIEDPDNDFWNNLAEYQNGTDPNNSSSFAPYSFTINGGTDETINAQVQLGFPGLVADYVIISESITMTNGVTNAFVSPLTYTLLNTNDGLHTIYLQLLKASGTLSPVFGRTTELDTHPPTISITSPTNGVTVSQWRVNIEGFAADASTTNAAVSDASRPLLVTVNPDLGIGASADFVNDRDTNGLWWSAQDLSPGTNTFTAIATDRAGWTVTNSVWLIYDPTLATNTPVFTIDVTNTITVASNATTIAVSGTIDDDNATIQIDVLDATDNTITNATVSAAVHGTNWWGEVPVVAGSNLVIISAANAASPPATNSFLTVQNTNVFLEIESPAAGIDLDESNVWVVGRASTNFNGSITINGLTAFTTNGPDGITFSNSVPINNVDANIIEVDAIGTDGSSSIARETVYGYQVVEFQRDWHHEWGHLNGDCWFSNHYPDSHADHGYGSWDFYTWVAPGRQFFDTSYEHVWSASGNLVDSDDTSGISTWEDWWFTSLDTSDSGEVQYHGLTTGTHVDGSGPGGTTWENEEDGRVYGKNDCPYETDCGDSIGACCTDYHEDVNEIQYGAHACTFVKHWPTDEEQTVILHFKDFYYYDNDTDVTKIKLWGQPGFAYEVTNAVWGLQTNVGFVVKIKTNTRYTLHETSFDWPTEDEDYDYNFSSPSTTYHRHEIWHQMYYDSFANAKPEIDIAGMDQSTKRNPGGLVVCNCDNNSPPRQQITIQKLGTTNANVVLTIPSQLKVFTAASNGVEVASGSPISSANLPTNLWVEGESASSSVRDAKLTLSLAGASSASDYVNFTVLWANLSVRISGTLDPDDHAAFLNGGNWPTDYGLGWNFGGGNGLGPIDCLGTPSLNYGYTIGKIEAKATLQPSAIGNLVTSGWNMGRTRVIIAWTNGTLAIADPPSGVYDADNRDTKALTPINGAIFSLDAPGSPIFGGTNINHTAEVYDNFHQYVTVTLGGTVQTCSVVQTWSYTARVDVDNPSNKVQLNQLGVTPISIPASPFYAPR